MLDVDYLHQAHRSGPSRLDRPLIYLTRSGVLRRRMLRALDAVARLHDKSLMLIDLPLRPGFERGGLIDGLVLCRWPLTVRGRKQEKECEASLDSLAGTHGVPSVHFVPVQSPVVRRPGWREFERGCLVIEEAAITVAALPPILRYLLAASDLGCDEDLWRRIEFVDSFADLAGAGEDLAALMRAFDERVLTTTDPDTREYLASDTASIDARARRRHGAPQACLAEFVAAADARGLAALLAAYGERQTGSGWTPHKIVSDLYRITARLLDLDRAVPTGTASRRRRAAATSNAVVLWAALVLAWDEAFLRSITEETGYRRGPSTLMVALAGLGRAFIDLRSTAERDDPLAGRWTALTKVLERRLNSTSDALTASRARLVGSLLEAVAARRGTVWWVRHLHLGLIAATEGAAAAALRRSTPFTVALGSGEPTPRPVLPVPTPAQMLGRDRAIEHLRRSIRGDQWSNMMLYGPNGVGKRTLAWLYAKALLCATERREEAPCGVCPSCRGFALAGTPMGVAEIDAARDLQAARTEAVVAAVEGATFTRGWVVIVRHAERYDPRLFDRFLEPMEFRARTAFVLLTNDPRGVRLAGRSRCDDVRVRPFAERQAVTMLQQMLATRDQPGDPEALALLARLSGGVPGRLQDLDGELAHVPRVNVAAIRTLRSFSGAATPAGVWSRLLAGDPAVVGTLMRRVGKDRAASVAHVQDLLRQVYLHGLCTLALPQPVDHFGGDDHRCMAASLRDQAGHRGQSGEAFWVDLARAWLCEHNTHDWVLPDESAPKAM